MAEKDVVELVRRFLTKLDHQIEAAVRDMKGAGRTSKNAALWIVDVRDKLGRAVVEAKFGKLGSATDHVVFPIYDLDAFGPSLSLIPGVIPPPPAPGPLGTWRVMIWSDGVRGWAAVSEEAN